MTIRVSNVTKQFGDFYALKDVSVEIPSGSLTALLGPSGGGKSTLLRVIAGLEQPDSGTVEISGQDLTTTPPQNRNVGFVFQHYAAFKHLTVARNVAFGLEIRKRPKAEVNKRVRELLELVHLENFADRYPAQLSGGQRQRMALARALAVEPRVLLLDEPFGALDAQVRKELRTWLRRLHDEVHVTTVFVTHDQEEAMDVADRIFVMAGGQVEQEGSPDELYDEPANDFVMSFLGPATRLRGRLVRPHDVELLATERPGAVRAHITRIVRLGFEVRVELTEDGAAPTDERSELAAAVDAAESGTGATVTSASGPLWAQLTREELAALDVGVGDAVFVRPQGKTLAKAV
jgi:sulfate transport system ATP-binding protein